MNNPADQVTEFHRLHSLGCFVMPNPWDMRQRACAGRNRLPGAGHDQRGFAWTLGLPDDQVALDQALDHFAPHRERCHRASQRGLPRRTRRRRRRTSWRTSRWQWQRGLQGFQSKTRRGTTPDHFMTSNLQWIESAPPAGPSMTAARVSFSPVAPRGLLSDVPTSTKRSEGFVPILRLAQSASTLRVSTRRSCRNHHRGGGSKTGERADQLTIHHGRPGEDPWRAPNQRWRHLSPCSLEGLDGCRDGDRKPKPTFTRFSQLPDVESLLSGPDRTSRQ